MKGSLQLRLSVAVSLALAAAGLVGGGAAFLSAGREAQQLQDDTLRQVAGLIARQHLAAPLRPGSIHLPPGAEDPALVLIGYDGARDPLLPLPPGLADGLHSLAVGHEAYRVLIAAGGAPGSRIAVAQKASFRDEIARDNARRTLVPLALLVPLLIAAVVGLVRRAFAPVARLAQEIAARDAAALQPLGAEGLPAEVRPFVEAIDRLLARVAGAMAQQRRFIADAAHELRSPLAALSLQAERLAAAELPEAARSRLDTLSGGIARNRRLLDQLLDLARVQAGGGAAGGHTGSVQAVFREVIGEAMELALAGGVDLGVVGEGDASLPVAPVDLAIMLRNIVHNALRHSPPGGRVDVGLVVAAGAVCISVSDQGPGIAPAERARVFAPFYRIAGSAGQGAGQGSGQGSGLGLSIVAALASRNGAVVRLDDAEGGGLRVEIGFAAGAPGALA